MTHTHTLKQVGTMLEEYLMQIASDDDALEDFVCVLECMLSDARETQQENVSSSGQDAVVGT